MSDAITQQHPAVVLRSHYVHLRTLLAVALIALVGLTVALIVVATNTPQPVAQVAAPELSAPAPAVTATSRYDGGPNEGTRGIVAGAPTPGVRYDGGPEEGTRGPGH